MIFAFPTAYKIAQEAHRDDTRWGGEPYMTHVDAVIAGAEDLLLEARESSLFVIDSIKAIAALHDVVEDHADVWPLARVKEVLFDGGIKGSQLTNIVLCVDALTHKSEDTYAEYISKVTKYPWSSAVKAADLKHNLRDSTGQRKQKYELALMIVSKYI